MEYSQEPSYRNATMTHELAVAFIDLDKESFIHCTAVEDSRHNIQLLRQQYASKKNKGLGTI